MVPGAVIVPLGRAVSALLHAEVNRGAVEAERCQFDFPYPSGANGHRKEQYEAHREAMAAQVAGWASARASVVSEVPSAFVNSVAFEPGAQDGSAPLG